jgi:chaperonin cofactor prefoldin
MECTPAITPASAPPATDEHKSQPAELEKRIATLRQVIATLDKQLHGLRARLRESLPEQ